MASSGRALGRLGGCGLWLLRSAPKHPDNQTPQKGDADSTLQKPCHPLPLSKSFALTSMCETHVRNLLAKKPMGSHKREVPLPTTDLDSR